MKQEDYRCIDSEAPNQLIAINIVAESQYIIYIYGAVGQCAMTMF